MNPNEGLTIKEIAAIIRCSEETVSKWIKIASAKYPQLKEGVPHYGFKEVLIILRAGGLTAKAMLLSRIYQLFARRNTIDIRSIHRLIELASAESLYTGKYIMVKDVVLILGEEYRQHTKMSVSYIKTKVNEIRAIFDKFDTGSK